MKTKDTLHITLNGGTAQRRIALRRGKGVLVSATSESGLEALTVSTPLPANLIAAHHREVTDLKRKIDELKQQLATANDEKEQLMVQKAQADELLLLLGQSDYVSALVAKRHATTAPTRTALEARCFIGECDTQLIKSRLDAYIASPRCRWKESYWCIVWQIFTDLKWWVPKSTLQDFVDWVTQSGHTLGIDNFKHTKSRLKARLQQWQSLTGSDDFALTVRALDQLFTGGSSMLSVAQYETAYVDHSILKTRRISVPDKRRDRTSIHIDKGVLRSYGRLHRHTRRWAISRTEVLGLTLNPQSYTLTPTHYTTHTKHYTQNPKHYTLNTTP